MLATLLALVQEDGGGGLQGPFKPEPGLIIWTWLVFIILFFLLRKYAWPPIVRLTEERERLIAKQLAEAGQANADAKAADKRSPSDPSGWTRTRAPGYRADNVSTAPRLSGTQSSRTSMSRAQRMASSRNAW